MTTPTPERAAQPQSRGEEWFVMANTNPSEDQRLVSIWSGPETKEYIICNSCSPEDARIIVRAVNSHAELLAALHSLRQATTWAPGYGVSFAEFQAADKAAQSAIAKATQPQ